jgi:parallel beta-helix repeat protein
MMRRIGVLAVLLLAGAGTTFGLIVDTIGAGKDFPSFPEAAASLPANLNDDYLFVAMAGTYDDSMTEVTFTRSNNHTVTFRPVDGASVTVGPGADDDAFSVFDCDHIIFENLTINSGPDVSAHAILFDAAPDCKVKGCYIRALGEFGIESQYGCDNLVIDSCRLQISGGGGIAPIAIDDDSNSRITRCLVWGSSDYGIYASESPGVVIESTSVTLTSGADEGAAIYLTPDPVKGRSDGFDPDPAHRRPDMSRAGKVPVDGSGHSRISDCSISMNGSCGIRVDDSRHVDIDRTPVYQYSYASLYGAYGILLYDISDSGAIRNCPVKAQNVSGTQFSHGIYIDDSKSVVIDSCQVNQQTVGSHWGIRIASSSNRNVVSRCTVATASYTGIYIQGSNYVTIESCAVVGSQGGFRQDEASFDIFAESDTSCRFLGNRLRGSASYGISLDAGSCRDSILGNRILTQYLGGIITNPGKGHVIANNFIYGWSVDAIHTYLCDSIRIYCNSIYGPLATGASASSCVSLSSSKGIRLKDNIVRNQGDSVTYGSYCYSLSSSTLDSSDYNDLATNYAVAKVDGTVYSTLADWRNYTLPNGSHPDLKSISADPKFQDLKNGDLHLKWNSPCIDSGTTVPGISYDIDHNSRSAPWDIGADEYVEVTPVSFTLIRPPDDTVMVPLNPTLIWHTSVGARVYDVYLDTSASAQDSFATVADTFLNLTGLLENTYYYWYVRARNTVGTRISDDAPWRFRTTVATPGSFNLLAPPDGATGQPIDVRLRWEVAARTDTYLVYLYRPSMSPTIVSRQTDTSYTCSGLFNDSTYYWTVEAKNVAGITPTASGTWDFRTIVLPPTAFNLTTPANLATNVPVLTHFAWNAALNGTVTYDLYLSTTYPPGGTPVRTGLTSAWFDTTGPGLDSGQTYYWTVKANNAGGSRWAQDTFRFTTVPRMPAVFNLLAPSDGAVDQPVNVRLRWEASAWTDTYLVYLYRPSMSPVIVSRQVDTGYNCSGLFNDSTYSWTVEAKNFSGTRQTASGTWYFRTIVLPPTSFNLTTPSNLATNVPVLTHFAWNAALNGSVTYDLYLSTTYPPGGAPVVTGLSTAYFDTLGPGLDSSQTYYWTVKAVNAGGSRWAQDTFRFTTMPRMPASFSLLNPADGSVNVPVTVRLEWLPSTNGSITYDVYWGNPPTQRVASGIPWTYYDTTRLVNDTNYRWTVKASNYTGSRWSDDTFDFRTTPALPTAFHLRFPRRDSMNAPTSIHLEWDPSVNGTVTYDLYWGNPPAVLVASGLGTNSYDTAGLGNGVAYTWTVRAVNAAGATWSRDTFVFTTEVDLPTSFHLRYPRNDSTNTPTTIHLEWFPATNGLVTYDVFWGSPPESLVRAGLGFTFFDTFGLEVNKTYYWTVRARNITGSTWSLDTFHFRTGSGGISSGYWQRMANILIGPRRKYVKDGGFLAYAKEPGNDTPFVYALKGNNTYEFYRYNVTTNVWITRESIPAYNRLMKKKAVKKGSTLMQAGDGRLYATKGNSTYDFWQYDPAKPPGTRWTQIADVPPGAKSCREGVGSAAVTYQGTDYVYLLKGSNTFEFYRYNVDDNTWAAMTPAPFGASGRAYKNGSCITYDGVDTIYALKGTYNEFFAYSVAANKWETRDTLPRMYPPGTQKKKVKDGAAIAYYPPVVYALKGGNTNEFWGYNCTQRRWLTAPPMPTVIKRVKGGGSLVLVPDVYSLFAFRGNATLEFWEYGPLGPADYPLAVKGPDNTMASTVGPLTALALNVTPNPFTSLAVIRYSLPRPARVRLTLYDVAGRLVSVLASGHHPAGNFDLGLSAAESGLSAGVYLLKFESEDGSITRKLIIE